MKYCTFHRYFWSRLVPTALDSSCLSHLTDLTKKHCDLLSQHTNSHQFSYYEQNDLLKHCRHNELDFRVPYKDCCLTNIQTRCVGTVLQLGDGETLLCSQARLESEVMLQLNLIKRQHHEIEKTKADLLERQTGLRQELVRTEFLLELLQYQQFVAIIAWNGETGSEAGKQAVGKTNTDAGKIRTKIPNETDMRNYDRVENDWSAFRTLGNLFLGCYKGCFNSIYSGIKLFWVCCDRTTLRLWCGQTWSRATVL